MKAPFVIALESLFFGAACEQPIVLGDAKFLEALAAHGHAAVTTGAAGIDKSLQALLGLGAQGFAVAFQVTVKRCGCQKCALEGTNSNAPVLHSHRLGLTWESFVKPRLIAKLHQLFFGLLVSGIAIGHETGQRLDGLVFNACAVAAVMLRHQQRSVEYRGGVAGQHLAMNAHGQGQAVTTMVGGAVATDTALAAVAGHAGFVKQGFAQGHTLGGERGIFEGRAIRQGFEQSFGSVQQSLVVAGCTYRAHAQQRQATDRGRRSRRNQPCPFTHDYP